MFICQQCGLLSKHKVKPVTKVIGTRPKTYEDGSKGHEIVREIKICSSCV